MGSAAAEVGDEAHPQKTARSEIMRRSVSQSASESIARSVGRGTARHNISAGSARRQLMGVMG